MRSLVYDGLGRVESDTLRDDGLGIVSQVFYGYDPDGNLTSRDVMLAGNDFEGIHEYSYDNAGRLTSWTFDSTTVDYTWDDAGNRIQAGTDSFMFDERNRLTSGPAGDYTYTPRGTLAEVDDGQDPVSYTFDPLGRMTEAGGVEYSYDGLGRVATRDADPFSYTGFSLDPTAAGGYTYGRTPGGRLLSISDGEDGLLAGLDRHGDLTHLFTPDGTVTDTVLYDPFGVPLHTTGGFSPQVGYQGDWTDPDSGEVWMGARWYDPSTASFLSRDTVVGELSTPMSLNRYLYGWANPLGYWDPDGRAVYPTARGDGYVEDWTRNSDGSFTRNHQRVAPDRNHLAAPQGFTKRPPLVEADFKPPRIAPPRTGTATTKAEETVVFTPTLRDLPPLGTSCPAGAAGQSGYTTVGCVPRRTATFPAVCPTVNLGVAALTVGGCTGGLTIRDLFPPPATGGTLTGGEDCNRLSGTAQSMCVRRQLEHLPTGYTPPLQLPQACPGAPTWANTTCNNLGLLGGYNIHINADDGGAKGESGADFVGRGRQVAGPFPSSAAPDEVLVRLGEDGSVSHYQVYGPDGLPVRRVDVTGRSHGDIPTPHVVEFERHVNPATGEVFVRPGSTVRPARPDEVP